MVNWCSTSYRNFIINSKKKSLLASYEKGKYEQMAKLFKT
jgi:hypothetical protein